MKRENLLDKVFYFKVGSKDIRLALPKDGLGRFFTIAMIGIFIFDACVGSVFGMFLMGLFVAMNTLQIK